MKGAGIRQLPQASQPFQAERAQTALLAGACAVL